MIIFNFDKRCDLANMSICLDCRYQNKKVDKLVKIGSFFCQLCDYNKNKSAYHNTVYCNLNNSKINAEYFWYDNEWLNEEEYNMRFISDDNISL